MRATFEKSLKATNDLQAQVTAIDQQITDISDKQVKGLRTKIKELKNQIDKLTSNVSKLRAELDANERNIQKAQECIENCQTEITTAETSIREYDIVRKECVEDKGKIEEKLKELEEELENTSSGFGELKKDIASLLKKENEGRMKRLEIEQKLETIQGQIKDFKRAIPHWENKLKPLKLHQIPNEPEPEPFKQFTEEELNGYAVADIQYQYTSQEEQLSKSKPNFSVIEEFNKKRETYLERVRDLEDVTAKRNEMRQTYDDVRKLRFSEFMSGFNIITKKLKEMYRMITLGGDAELELVDSMDPFNEGIVFSVRPPKKSWKSISNLSGGEKTLSSLALVFALHYYKPSPLYVMDEIDAALDFKNVSIVANYIKDRTKNAQFIIISLRANMFELSDYLVGICKYEDCTASCTMKNTPPPRPTSIMQASQGLTDGDAAFNILKQNLTQTSTVDHTQDKEPESEEAPLDESGLNNTVIENVTSANKTIEETNHQSSVEPEISAIDHTVENENVSMDHTIEETNHLSSVEPEISAIDHTVENEDVSMETEQT